MKSIQYSFRTEPFRDGWPHFLPAPAWLSLTSTLITAAVGIAKERLVSPHIPLKASYTGKDWFWPLFLGGHCGLGSHLRLYCYAQCPNPQVGREKASKTMQLAKRKFIADSSQGSCHIQRSGAGSESPEPELLHKFIGWA